MVVAGVLDPAVAVPDIQYQITAVQVTTEHRYNAEVVLIMYMQMYIRVDVAYVFENYGHRDICPTNVRNRLATCLEVDAKKARRFSSSRFFKPNFAAVFLFIGAKHS